MKTDEVRRWSKRLLFSGIFNSYSFALVRYGTIANLISHKREWNNFIVLSNSVRLYTWKLYQFLLDFNIEKRPKMIWRKENQVGNHIKCAPFLDSKIQTRILRFFTKQINPISLESWCINGSRRIHSEPGWIHNVLLKQAKCHYVSGVYIVY